MKQHDITIRRWTTAIVAAVGLFAGTDSYVHVYGLARDWHQRWTPMGRLGTPADAGNIVALMCSDEASWITGQTIYADGGASLMDTVLPLEMQIPQLVTV